MGKLSANGPFSVAMLIKQRVIWFQVLSRAEVVYQSQTAAARAACRRGSGQSAFKQSAMFGGSW